MKMKSSNGCFNTVIFNDEEIEHRQNKTSTPLECCFALPECFSPDDVNAGDLSPDDVDHLLPTTAAEQQQQEKGVDVHLVEEDFPVDFNRAFGLTENDEAQGSMDQTTTPPKAKVVSPYKLNRSKSSPTSVISPSVYDTPTKLEQRHRAMCRSRMTSRAMGSYNKSDPYDKILNDNDHSNHDAGSVSKRPSFLTPKPKGILRNKQDNALDRYLKPKVLKRSRSEGHSVQFRTNWIYYVENEKVNTTVMQTPSDLQLLGKVCNKKDSRMKKGLQCPELGPTSPAQPQRSTIQKTDWWWWWTSFPFCLCSL